MAKRTKNRRPVIKSRMPKVEQSMIDRGISPIAARLLSQRNPLARRRGRR